jgi:LPXTG-site transpeptidase (sortase) family protein
MQQREPLHWVLALSIAGMLGLVGIALDQQVWTNYASHVRATKVREHLLNDWQRGHAVSHTSGDWHERSGWIRTGARSVAQSDAFALMYIPRLVDHVWATPILEGVNPQELDSGVGHYLGTALPGQQGNFAVAGHRATHGEPFAYFDHLQRGDRVYVRTMGSWYVYMLDKNLMVQPKDVWVIDPHPGQLWRSVPSDRLVSLVTCDPRWGSARRWVWWGHLVATHPRDEPPLEVRSVQASK